jgi:hypothetical protein
MISLKVTEMILELTQNKVIMEVQVLIHNGDTLNCGN